MPTKLKNRDLLFKAQLTKIEDIDNKGIVKFYASVFNNKDKAGDIIVKGAYAKTLAENFQEIQHYKNHDSRIMPGVLTEAKEDDKGLLCTSKLILGTTAGKETYEEYKAMAEAGKSMFHSIGYIPVKWDEDRENEVTYLKEIMLREVSTLTAHPANSLALTEDIKSEIDFIDQLLKSDLSDVTLEKLEAIKHKIQSLIETKRAVDPQHSKQNEPTITRDELKQIFKF